MKTISLILTLDERDIIVKCVSDIVYTFESLDGYWLSDREKEELKSLSMKIAKT